MGNRRLQFLVMLSFLAVPLSVAAFAQAQASPAAPTGSPAGRPMLAATATPPPPGPSVDKPGTLYRRLGVPLTPDHQAVQEFRRQFLGSLDTLDKLFDEQPMVGVAASFHRKIQEQRQRVLAFTDDEVALLRAEFKDYALFDANLKAAEVEARAASRGGQIDKRNSSQAAPQSFPSVPTPTPVTTPTPGIIHDNTVADEVNELLGDLWEPEPAPPMCPKNGYPYQAMFAMMIAVDVAKEASVIGEALCKEKTVVCPGTDVQDPIECIVATVIKWVELGLETLKDSFEWCNDELDSATYQAIYQDTRIIHADLHLHDQNITDRYNMTDHSLFDFRNLNLRLEIEANLASANNNPPTFYMLPRAVCISPNLETLQLTDPYSPDVIAGCGLIELVQDTVRTTIDMTMVSGQSVNNAEAEYQAALDHVSRGEWKLAYARFRKAYREAVRTP